MVLAIGNYMNTGIAAQGFRIHFLQQVLPVLPPLLIYFACIVKRTQNN